MEYKIREMTVADYAQVYQLWTETEHLNVDESDTIDRFTFYLRRNPGLCFVAIRDGRVIGTVLCGHEGRRGFMRHLAVDKECRGYGIARELVKESLRALAAEGVRKCNATVFTDNKAGFSFWERLGWYHLPNDFEMIQVQMNSAN